MEKNIKIEDYETTYTRNVYLQKERKEVLVLERINGSVKRVGRVQKVCKNLVTILLDDKYYLIDTKTSTVILESDTYFSIVILNNCALLGFKNLASTITIDKIYILNLKTLVTINSLVDSSCKYIIDRYYDKFSDFVELKFYDTVSGKIKAKTKPLKNNISFKGNNIAIKDGNKIKVIYLDNGNYDEISIDYLYAYCIYDLGYLRVECKDGTKKIYQQNFLSHSDEISDDFSYFDKSLTENKDYMFKMMPVYETTTDDIVEIVGTYAICTRTINKKIKKTRKTKEKEFYVYSLREKKEVFSDSFDYDKSKKEKENFIIESNKKKLIYEKNNEFYLLDLKNMKSSIVEMHNQTSKPNKVKYEKGCLFICYENGYYFINTLDDGTYLEKFFYNKIKYSFLDNKIVFSDNSNEYLNNKLLIISLIDNKEYYLKIDEYPYSFQTIYNCISNGTIDVFDEHFAEGFINEVSLEFKKYHSKITLNGTTSLSDYVVEIEEDSKEAFEKEKYEKLNEIFKMISNYDDKSIKQESPVIKVKSLGSLNENVLKLIN